MSRSPGQPTATCIATLHSDLTPRQRELRARRQPNHGGARCRTDTAGCSLAGRPPALGPSRSPQIPRRLYLHRHAQTPVSRRVRRECVKRRHGVYGSRHLVAFRVCLRRTASEASEIRAWRRSGRGVRCRGRGGDYLRRELGGSCGGSRILCERGEKETAGR